MPEVPTADDARRPGRAKVAVRRIPGWEIPISTLGVGWPTRGASAAVALSNPLVASRLIAARQSGVTLFDFSTSTGVDALQLAVLRDHPSAGPGPVFLVRPGLPPVSSHSGMRSPETEAQGRRVPVVPLGDRRARAVHRNLEARDGGSDWAVGLPGTRVDRTELAAAWDEGARVALVPGSLLDAAALGELAVSLPPDRGGLIITDPFADGLFDGQFLNSGGSSPIAPGLSDGESLRQRFAPVLRFGFLPVARRRTLAQASLLYLLSIPRVVSVIVPLDSPEGLAQGLALPEVPRLTAEEREKVRVLSRELV